MHRPPVARPALCACAAFCAALTLWSAPAAARDAGKATGAAPSQPASPAREPAASDARDCVPTERAGAKVVDIYWTRGPDNQRITDGQADHYVDLNLVVRTAGYVAGDCVEATVQAADGGDIVEGRQALALRGRVDKAGVAYFKEPLRRYTLILSDGADETPASATPDTQAP